MCVCTQGQSSNVFIVDSDMGTGLRCVYKFFPVVAAISINTKQHTHTHNQRFSPNMAIWTHAFVVKDVVVVAVVAAVIREVVAAAIVTAAAVAGVDSLQSPFARAASIQCTTHMFECCVLGLRSIQASHMSTAQKKLGKHCVYKWRCQNKDWGSEKGEN